MDCWQKWHEWNVAKQGWNWNLQRLFRIHVVKRVNESNIVPLNLNGTSGYSPLSTFDFSVAAGSGWVRWGGTGSASPSSKAASTFGTAGRHWVRGLLWCNRLRLPLVEVQVQVASLSLPTSCTPFCNKLRTFVHNEEQCLPQFASWVGVWFWSPICLVLTSLEPALLGLKERWCF